MPCLYDKLLCDKPFDKPTYHSAHLEANVLIPMGSRAHRMPALVERAHISRPESSSCAVRYLRRPLDLYNY